MSRRPKYQSARNKYGVAPKDERTQRGIVFASKGEKYRHADLTALQMGGHIRHMQRQVRYKLILPNGTPIVVGKRVAVYTADFVYEEKQGDQWIEIIEDFKGKMTAEAKFRIAVFEAIYGVKVRLTKRTS